MSLLSNIIVSESSKSSLALDKAVRAGGRDEEAGLPVVVDTMYEIFSDFVVSAERRAAAEALHNSAVAAQIAHAELAGVSKEAIEAIKEKAAKEASERQTAPEETVIGGGNDKIYWANRRLIAKGFKAANLPSREIPQEFVELTLKTRVDSIADANARNFEESAEGNELVKCLFATFNGAVKAVMRDVAREVASQLFHEQSCNEDVLLDDGTVVHLNKPEGTEVEGDDDGLFEGHRAPQIIASFLDFREEIEAQFQAMVGFRPDLRYPGLYRLLEVPGSFQALQYLKYEEETGENGASTIVYRSLKLADLAADELHEQRKYYAANAKLEELARDTRERGQKGGTRVKLR